MRKILLEDKAKIDGKPYILRTVDLSASPLCDTEELYEQLLYSEEEDGQFFATGHLLDRCFTEEEAIHSHNAQLSRINNGEPLIECY